MDQARNGITHILDTLLNDHYSTHQIFNLHHPEQDAHHQNMQKVTGSKKKGRPKGLKTNKAKTTGKEENKQEKLNKGHWLQEQNKKYHWFLEIYSKHFIMKQLRRMDKIFKTMAQFIGTRQAEQCRSHHQKMEKKYHSFYKIIRNLRMQFFSSADPSYVKDELQSHEIYDYDPLIGEQMLDKEQEIVEADEQKDYSKECEISVGRNQNNNSLMFGDNYENILKYDQE